MDWIRSVGTNATNGHVMTLRRCVAYERTAAPTDRQRQFLQGTHTGQV